MSETRGKASSVTDPGPPPAEALDANLHAFSAPVDPEVRESAMSNGFDAARYHAEPHAPPRAHSEPSKAAHDTEPMAREVVHKRSAVATAPGRPVSPKRGAVGLTFGLVLIALGAGTWVIVRAPGATRSIAGIAPGSTAAATSGRSATRDATIDAAGEAIGADVVASGASKTTMLSAAQPVALASSSSFSPETPPTAVRRGDPSSRHGTAALGAPPPAPHASSDFALPPSVAGSRSPPPTLRYNRFLEEDRK